MSELDLLLCEIEKLHRDLAVITAQNSTAPLDPEVLVASKMLYAAMDKYHQILLRKLNTPARPVH